MVPSPPSTTISSMPSSGRTGLTSGATASASRGSMADRSSGGKTETMPAALQPLDQPVGRADGGRAAGVGEHRHPARRGPGRCAAAAGSVTGPAYSCRLARVEQQEELLVAGDSPASRLGVPLARAGQPRPSARGRHRGPRPPGGARRRGPPRPGASRSRPTSNCGLTSSSNSPSGGGDRGQRRDQQGERDEGHVGHHQVDRPLVHVGQGQVAAGWSARHDRTRGSARSGSASWPVPTSTAITCRQPRSSSTWVNPPVEAPGVQRPAGHGQAQIVQGADQLVRAAGDVRVGRGLDHGRRRRPARRPGGRPRPSIDHLPATDHAPGPGLGTGPALGPPARGPAVAIASRRSRLDRSGRGPVQHLVHLGQPVMVLAQRGPTAGPADRAGRRRSPRRRSSAARYAGGSSASGGRSSARSSDGRGGLGSGLARPSSWRPSCAGARFRVAVAGLGRPPAASPDARPQLGDLGAQRPALPRPGRNPAGRRPCPTSATTRFSSSSRLARLACRISSASLVSRSRRPRPPPPARRGPAEPDRGRRTIANVSGQTADQVGVALPGLGHRAALPLEITLSSRYRADRRTLRLAL